MIFPTSNAILYQLASYGPCDKAELRRCVEQLATDGGDFDAALAGLTEDNVIEYDEEFGVFDLA